MWFFAADYPAVEKLLAQQDYRAALGELSRIPQGQPAARWHLLASKAYDGLDDPARAVEEAEAALALEYLNESHHLQLAQIFLVRNTPGAAYEILTEATKLFPDSILVRLGRGLAARDLLMYDEAAHDLAECLRRKQDFALAFDALGSVYLSWGKPEELLPVASAYLERNPADFRGYYYLAAAKSDTGDPIEAEKLIHHSIKLNPEFAASHELLGRLRMEGGQFEEAIAELEKAVRIRPNYSPPRVRLANAYRRIDREEDAARQLEVVKKLMEVERRPAQTLKYHRGRKETAK